MADLWQSGMIDDGQPLSAQGREDALGFAYTLISRITAKVVVHSSLSIDIEDNQLLIMPLHAQLRTPSPFGPDTYLLAYHLHSGRRASSQVIPETHLGECCCNGPGNALLLPLIDLSYDFLREGRK